MGPMEAISVLLTLCEDNLSATHYQFQQKLVLTTYDI